MKPRGDNATGKWGEEGTQQVKGCDKGRKVLLGAEKGLCERETKGGESKQLSGQKGESERLERKW